MEENKWIYWEKTRANGTFYFVVMKGFIIAFASGTGFFILQFLNYDYDLSVKIYNFSIFILFALIFGFIWGLIEWFFSESAYQRSRNNKDFNIWIPKQKDNLK